MSCRFQVVYNFEANCVRSVLTHMLNFAHDTRIYSNILIRDTVASLAKTFIQRHTSSVPPNLHTHAPILNTIRAAYVSLASSPSRRQHLLSICVMDISLWTFPVSTYTVLYNTICKFIYTVLLLVLH